MTLESTLISLIVLVVLTLSVYPSVSGGDSGELLAESCLSYGVAHPPGYPLFTMVSHFVINLGKVFNRLCSDQSAYKHLFSPSRCVNTLCCVFTAGSCYYLSESITIYLSSRFKIQGQNEYKRDQHKACAAIGAVLFSLSPLTWEYSIGSEVFTLNNFLITLIIYHTVQVGTCMKTTPPTYVHDWTKSFKHSMIGAFVSGLALSNQHTSLLFIAPIAPYILYTLYKSAPHERKRVTMLLVTLKLAFLLILGLSPYCYLIFASQEAHLTPGSWKGNLTLWKGFLRHVLRDEYGTFSLAAKKNVDVEGSLIRWFAYILDTFSQFSAIGVFLSITGVVYSFKKQKQPSGVTTILFIALMHYLFWWNGVFSNLPLSNPMATEVLSRFYIQPNILICFFAGVGTFVLISGTNHEHRTVISRVALLLVTILCISRQSSSMFMQEPSKMIIHDYATSILASLPENSLLLSFSDLNWNSVRYFQACENKRNDVTHLSLQLMPYPWFERQKSRFYPHVSFPPLLKGVNTNRQSNDYSNFLLRFLRANINNKAFKGGIFIEIQGVLETDIETGGSYKDEFTLLNWGLLYRVLPLEEEDTHYSILRKRWQPKSLFQLKKVGQSMKDHISSSPREGSWEFAALSVFWNMHYQLGIHILGIALSLSSAMKKDDRLLSVYMQSLRASSKLLLQADYVNTKQGFLVHQNTKDVIKNTALSHMRLRQAAVMLQKLNSEIPSITTLNQNEFRQINLNTKKSVAKYLDQSNLSEDGDYSIFDHYYSQMASIAGN